MLKVGDFARVPKDLTCEYDNSVVDEMLQYRGQTGKVLNIGGGFCTLDVDDGKFIWDTSTLELVEVDFVDDPRVKIFGKLCDEMKDTFKAKNHDYGNSCEDVYEELGFVSYYVQLRHKMNRFKQLGVNKEINQVKNESVRDTLMDIACYALQAVIELEK